MSQVPVVPPAPSRSGPVAQDGGVPLHPLPFGVAPPGMKLAFEVEPANRLFRLRLARYRYQAGALARLLPAGPVEILDAGCGKGRFPGYWKRWGNPGVHPRITGMDISWKRLIGRAKMRGYGVLLAGDLTRPWPYRDGTFDAVLCEQVLEHLTDAQVRYALSEAKRVLKPGGVALLGTPVFTEPELWLAPIWTRLNNVLRWMKGVTEPPHLQHLSVGRLKRLIRGCGLEPEAVQGYRVMSLWYGWGEDWEWYYRFQQWLGRVVPSLCSEVTVTARKARQD
ncbi:MAG: methyltransferase domain-containing protein [Candidatus Brocadiae bacterium]|nr:methyltransferase domain-containing protein [Candidatus Brocadiia bacterium]